MISEFLKKQAAIKARTATVGRALIKCGHFAVRDVKIPVAVPYINRLQETHAEIVIGMNANGYVAVGVPAGVFETANAADLKAWVTGENKSFTEDTETAHREREIAILKELQSKYPDE